MDVDEAAARASGKTADHAGKTYYFCSESCKARFAASPGKFAAAGAAGQGGHDHPGEHVALQAAGSRP
jgi:YHS domain-containing protein